MRANPYLLVSQPTSHSLALALALATALPIAISIYRKRMLLSGSKSVKKSCVQEKALKYKGDFTNGIQANALYDLICLI